jgi:hypothetical protein
MRGPSGKLVAFSGCQLVLLPGGSWAGLRRVVLPLLLSALSRFEFDR